MADISRSRTMASPPQRVWDVLADFGSVSSWVDNVDHSCLLNGDGEAFGTTRRLQIGRNTLVERIVEFDPPTALAYAIEGLPSFLHHVVNRWTVRPTDEAAKVILTSRVEIATKPGGPRRRLGRVPRPGQAVGLHAERLGTTNGEHPWLIVPTSSS